MNQYNQLIIIGGGASIREGIDLGLWDKLKDKFVLGTNYSFNYFIPTALCAVDWKFYDTEREKLKDLPLVITRDRKKSTTYMPNTLPLQTDMHYKRDLSTGVYSGVLTGIFSLTLAIYLLDVGDIFLLGMDWTKAKDGASVPHTHFYQGQIGHRGIGKIDYYKSHSSSSVYGVYKNESKCKIYNVSLNSNITEFPKIGYAEFFDKLDKETYDQTTLRSSIRAKLSPFSR